MHAQIDLVVQGRDGHSMKYIPTLDVWPRHLTRQLNSEERTSGLLAHQNTIP